MADLKFSCPHCEQHIQAGADYAGMQINCPACNGALMVPGVAAPVAVPVPRPVPASTQTAPAPAPASDSGCPSCGCGLPRGAILCPQCGYNRATGQRIVAGTRVAPGRPGAPQWETPWYKTAYPYLGALFVVLGVLYFLGKQNPAVMLAFLATGVLYTLTVHIIVVVAAFRESAGTGFLTLCIPFYALYFVYKVSENDTLKVLYTSAVLLNIGLRFLPVPIE
jgi:hypothetical protein